MKNLQSQLRTFFFFLLSALTPLALFAQDLVPPGLNNVAESVKRIFTGPLVRAILICCLAGCAVAYGFNKDNEKMKRNIIAIGIAIVIIVGASGIVEVIWNASQS
jgi:hypothetical protein